MVVWRGTTIIPRIKVWLFILSGVVGLFCCLGCDQLQLILTAREIHENILTVDTHADTPFMMGIYPDYDPGQFHPPATSPLQIDFPRMKQGGLDAVIWVAFVFQGERTEAGNLAAKEKALAAISRIKQAVTDYPDLAELAFAPEDADRIEASGRRAIFIGMENGYPLGNDLSLVETFYALGVRYITLCHTSNNDICDSSTDPEGAEHDGLSTFGEQVVAEMNRLGLMVDVSHVSDDTVSDVLALSTAPVIASHSCARSVYSHPRNLPDNLITAISKKGGVVQITFYSSYVKAPDAETPDLLPSVSDFVDHIDHVVEIAGIDYVGIGSDFDGGGKLNDCQEVSQAGNITLKLVKRGYSEADIEKIWGGNLMRVFTEVVAAADNRTAARVGH